MILHNDSALHGWFEYGVMLVLDAKIWRLVVVHDMLIVVMVMMEIA